jgi:DNA-binding CsgD family transcriptional regulator
MLLERTDELAAISAALHRASLGHGSCLAIEGSPGIGKSVLLSAARLAAQHEGFSTVSAVGGRVETDYPYGIVRQLFERSALEDGQLLSGAAAHAAGVLGLPRSGQPGDDEEFAIAHALYWFASNLADRGPLLITIDDAQLCDISSLNVVHYLARRLDGLRVVVLVGAREVPGTGPLADLLTAPHVELLRPGLLSLEACTRIVSSRAADGATPAFVAACHVATGGNPFLLSELLRAVRLDGLDFDDDAVEAIGGLTPRAVIHAVLHRLAGLPGAATDLARAVATLGESAELRHAADLAGIAASDASALADALVEGGVLALGRPLRFVHPMIGDAVAEEIPGGSRGQLHHRAAKLLEADGHGPDRIARHVALTDELRDPWVVTTLRAASVQARDQGATETARRWLARAVAEGARPQDPMLLHELGEAEWLTGDAAAAYPHLTASLRGTHSADSAADTALLLARVLTAQADPGAAIEVIDTALAGGPSPERSHRLEAETATYSLLSGLSAATVRDRLLAVSATPSDEEAYLLIACSLAATYLYDGSAEQAVKQARAGLAGGRLCAAGRGDSFPVLAALTAFGLSDDEEADAVLDEALEHARRRSSKVPFANACGVASMAAWYRGELRRCEERAREAIEPGFATGYVQPIVHAYLALSLQAQGDAAGVEEALRSGGLNCSDLPSFQSTHASYAVARVLRLQGDPASALAVLQAHAARPQDEINQLPYPPWRLEAALCLLDLGDPDAATPLLKEHARHVRRWGTVSSRGMLQRAYGLQAKGPARVAHLRSAVATLDASPARLEYAYAALDLGRALHDAGAVVEAKASLWAGYDAAGSLGAAPLAEQARRELVALGARPRRRRTSGIDSLTARERRVCELALTGQSNSEIAQALFVTRSTVEKHLGRAYAKLEITSREQLPEILPSG